MYQGNNSRGGFALPVAVFALVIVGVLVTGGFYLAQQESRIGVASEKGSAAFYIAERGVSDILENWDPAFFGNVPVMQTKSKARTVDGGGYRVEVTKLSEWLYFLDSRGVVTEGGAVLGGATRRVGTLAKIRSINIDPPAALTTVQGIDVGGTTEVLGQDLLPAQWTDHCDPADMTNKPGVLIDDQSTMDFHGVTYTLDGYPGVAEEPTLTSDDLLTYGGLTWNELVSMATVTLAGGTTITQTEPDSVQIGTDWFCTTSDPLNWGDPLNPYAACGNHFPVIYGLGNLRIQSGDYGQGIILVEGDLQLTGGYNFYGPVIVKGRVATSGTGGHIYGALIAGNSNLSGSSVYGDATIQYSSCAVERAVLNNAGVAMAAPLQARSWVDLSNLTN